jgi:reactive intermediate/imine deaminase
MREDKMWPVEGGTRAGGHYSPAFVAGDLIFVSGQLPVLPNGAHAPDAEFDVQAERAIANLLAAAAAAGAAPQQIVRVCVYIAGIGYWPNFDRIYARRFGSHRPARTVVPVPGLHYGYLVEIDAVAIRT